MKRILQLAIALVLFGFVSLAGAAQQAQEYRFDPPHCNITFMVRHIFVNVPGRFVDFSGTVRFDPKNLEGSLFDVTVQAASLDTFVDKRNEHLRSAEFFDVAKYPEIRFTSSRITHKAGNIYAVKGTLTLKGVSRAVELPVTYFGKKANPMNPQQ